MASLRTRLLVINSRLQYLYKRTYCNATSDGADSSIKIAAMGNTTSNSEKLNTTANHAKKNLFDINAVEKIMRESAKDLPIDMTNPYEREPISCILCRYKVEPDYKNSKLLSQFVSSFTGNIYERHITRLCQKKQDLLVKEIRKSRTAGFMMTLFKNVEYMKDPKLFDPNNPIKPHPH